MAGLEIRPFNIDKVKLVTADEKEVKDMLGYAEADIILGNQKLEKVKMIVFKNVKNPCLKGRDILATPPDTKQHFEALMGNKQSTVVQPDRKETALQKGCNTRHFDRNSDDDYDDEIDRTQDNSMTKGC